MKIVPKRDQVLGRILDLTKTEGGIALPTTEVRNVTIIVLVDAVGPMVTDCKPGDIVLPQRVSQISLRGGKYQYVLMEEKDVRAAVLEVPLERFTMREAAA